jgi:hypothetical protein
MTPTLKPYLCVKCEAQLIEPEVVNDALPIGHYEGCEAARQQLAHWMNELPGPDRHFKSWDMKEPWRRALDAYRQVLITRLKESHLGELNRRVQAGRHGGNGSAIG